MHALRPEARTPGARNGNDRNGRNARKGARLGHAAAGLAKVALLNRAQPELELKCQMGCAAATQRLAPARSGEREP